jgi:dTDP-4-dehydrorhamnose 3,5-epimerase
MNVLPTELPGVLILEPRVHRDARGFFLETWHAERYAAAGVDFPFVQDNHSCSARGILRGLHTQLEQPQGKLVRVVRGRILDVAVDIRLGSPTFGRYAAVELDDEEFRQMWVPPCFAHGFLVLSDVAEVHYKCTDFYHPSSELCIRWDDPEIGIPWPVDAPELSRKDREAPTLAEARERLPRY